MSKNKEPAYRRWKWTEESRKHWGRENNRLRAIRCQKGFTLSGLAKVSNLSRSLVRSYEERFCMPSDKSLKALAIALDVSIEYLVGDGYPTLENPYVENFILNTDKMVEARRGLGLSQRGLGKVG